MRTAPATLAGLIAFAGLAPAQGLDSTSLDASAVVSFDTNLDAEFDVAVDAGFFVLMGDLDFVFDDFDIPASDPLLFTGGGDANVDFVPGETPMFGLDALNLSIADLSLPPLSDASTAADPGLGEITVTFSLDSFSAQNVTVSLANPTGLFPVEPDGTVNPLGVAFNIRAEIFFSATASVDGTGLLPGILGGITGSLPIAETIDNGGITGDASLPVVVDVTASVDDNLVLNVTEDEDTLTASAFFRFDESVLDLDAILTETLGTTLPFTFSDVFLVIEELVNNGTLTREEADTLIAELESINDIATIDFAIAPALNDLVADLSFTAEFPLPDGDRTGCNAADLNGDGLNTLDDILVFTGAFDVNNPSDVADLNGDGLNTLDDILVFTGIFDTNDPACLGG